VSGPVAFKPRRGWRGKVPAKRERSALFHTVSVLTQTKVFLQQLEDALQKLQVVGCCYLGLVVQELLSVFVRSHFELYKRRYRPGKVALREIRQYQRSTELLMHFFSFLCLKN